jgi:uncharacterized protein (DUF2237 family)
MTGYYRDGYCKNFPNDTGSHVVCAKMTNTFLQFTKSKGNDLITPSPEHNFPGLKEGQHWCVCANRWEEARKEGNAPPVFLNGTDKSALQFNSLETYRNFAERKGGVRRKSRKTKKKKLSFKTK